MNNAMIELLSRIGWRYISVISIFTFLIGCASTYAGESVKSSAIYLQGIDVSHYQGDIDWQKVQSSGVVFAFAKAAEGENSGDSKFAQNWQAMKAAGIIRGAYDYFEVGEDPVKEAEDFISRVKLDSDDLPPVVDIETLGSSQEDNSTLATHLQSYLDTLEKAFNVKPIIYTGLSFANEHLSDEFSEYTLWLAEYADHPTVPKGWTNWTFWQYSQTGSINGIDGAVDLDRFQGDLEKLKNILVP